MTQSAAAEPVNELMLAALEYREQGRPIFPVCWTEPHQHRVAGRLTDCEEKNRGKTPLVPWKDFQSRLPTEREVRRWWHRWPTANIGMATGRLSGIVVGDLDGELAQAKATSYGYAPGPYVLTGRPGGRHLFFAWREDAPHNFAKKEGIDFRGDGGFVVLPPSRHILGTTYRWGQVINSLVELPFCPEWFDVLAGNIEHNQQQRAAVVDEGIPEHERNGTLISLGGSMRRRGMSETEILAALSVVNQERCQPPLSDDEVAKIAHSAASYAPEDVPVRQHRRRQERAFDASRIVTVTVEDIVEEVVVWLWEQRLPEGMFVLLQGDAGLGKSVLAIDIAARVSTGRAMPDEPANLVRDPRDVVMLVNEDDLASTIRPRLRLAGADLSRVTVIKGQYDDENNIMPLTIEDLRALRHVLERQKAAMLLIDPLFGHLPAGVSINREEEIRHLLAPLIALIAELDVVLVGIRHLNQAIDLPYQYRGLGASTWTAQARSQLSVMVDPTNDAVGRNRYVFGRSKGNLGIEPPVLTYTLEAEDKNAPPYIVWGEPLPMTWIEVVHIAMTTKKTDSAVGKAKVAVLETITEAGADGITWPAVMEIIEPLGHSEHSARRARAELAPDIISRKSKTDDGQIQTRWYRLEHLTATQDKELDQSPRARGRARGGTPQVGQVGKLTEENPPENTDNLTNLPNLMGHTHARAIKDGKTDENGVVSPKRPKPEPPAWDEEKGEQW